uniref:Uncharacterized protein n=1 Tax=Kryptolebias marmoratus TaxID=37003 RepID=A0A3Q3AWQ0_KRYMA
PGMTLIFIFFCFRLELHSHTHCFVAVEAESDPFCVKLDKCCASRSTVFGLLLQVGSTSDAFGVVVINSRLYVCLQGVRSSFCNCFSPPCDPRITCFPVASFFPSGDLCRTPTPTGESRTPIFSSSPIGSPSASPTLPTSSGAPKNPCAPPNHWKDYPELKETPDQHLLPPLTCLGLEPTAETLTSKV